MKPSAGNNQRRRGLAAVEAAIVLPLILLATFAVLEYGWLFVRYHQVCHAARHGARLAARDSVQPLNTHLADVQTQVGQYLTSVGVKPGTWTFFPNEVATQAGGVVEITVMVNYTSNGLGLPLIPKPGQLQSKYRTTREGP
jgi:Flp pilus assembly protein TadG